jgi:hypothetical protein
MFRAPLLQQSHPREDWDREALVGVVGCGSVITEKRV